MPRRSRNPCQRASTFSASPPRRSARLSTRPPSTSLLGLLLPLPPSTLGHLPLCHNLRRPPFLLQTTPTVLHSYCSSPIIRNGVTAPECTCAMPAESNQTCAFGDSMELPLCATRPLSLHRRGDYCLRTPFSGFLLVPITMWLGYGFFFSPY